MSKQSKRKLHASARRGARLFAYSKRNASIGSSAAARYAG